MTEGELKELDFGSWKDIAYKDEKIATLEEALALCKELDVARVQLEMKAPLLYSDAFVEQVVEQVRAAGLGEKLVLTSFNHDHLKLAKQQMPELQVGRCCLARWKRWPCPKAPGKRWACRTAWTKTRMKMIFHSCLCPPWKTWTKKTAAS